ncbi:MAG: urea carboxylase-associated family protein [Rhodobacteraceae bacterium]|nr:MAG: urea carboxylase-associated family protein [Paracoccaceae bacterium]
MPHTARQPNDGFGPGRHWPSAEDLAVTGNATLASPVSPDGTPEPGRRYEIPARHGLAVRLRAGQRVRVINTHGTQVVDSWAFNAADPTEFMSMEHARAGIDRIIPKAPCAMLSNKRRPILFFEEDASPGVHDTIIAACDIWRYRGLGVEGYHDNCDDNLHMALAAIGFAAAETPSPFNLFMNIPVRADGSIGWEPSPCAPGDHVTFRAEMDVVYAVSACPQDIIPINNRAPVEAHLVVLA